MNKYMYVGLIIGLIISIVLNKTYPYQNPSLVTVICVVIGTFAGASLDNKSKKKDDKDMK
ncbi:MAG: hypothetical protein PUG67_07640 [Peptoniphilaceae bacterium]|nr:hypothetical protein [Peptoniphilaceae bacterium]MDY6019319.1 hypothetical protein [Anaerococcus sp.]